MMHSNRCKLLSSDIDNALKVFGIEVSNKNYLITLNNNIINKVIILKLSVLYFCYCVI